MRTRSWAKFLPFVLMLLSVALHGEDSAEPYRFFRQYAGLTDDQVESIKGGQAFAKIINSGTADEVIVFGAVYVQATPESYLRFAGDISRLRSLPGYLAIRKFSDPPQLSDLDGFTLEPDDIRDLQHCRLGKCEVQLPAGSMEEFQRSVDWSAPGAATQVNRLAQKMALQALLGYMQGGNAALGVYRDKNHPTEVAETFKSLLSRSQALPTYLPEFDRYLLDYPDVKLPNVQTQFYWEKVNFGLKPTLRIVQAIIYRGSGPAEPAYTVAVKQLYSSHYFQTALDLTVCATDQQRPNQRGFYLITLKGSQQAGLTGLKGSIVRKVAVDKTRSSLERALVAIKQSLEAETQIAASGRPR
jgi:hypothetical protein